MNRLYYGDNLQVLREHIPTESVDLVYLDPPFNSNRSYNVLFKERAGDEAQAQIEAFDDTWTWSQEAEHLFVELMNSPASNRVKDALEAMRKILGDNDVLAYLVMMGARLIELHRVLKGTGSIYLHCDPTASHYLKILLDSIFGPDRFKSEIIWKRYGSHNDAKGYGAVHDVILFYAKGKTITFNKQFQPYEEAYVRERFRFTDLDGRRWAEQNLSSPNPRPNLTYPYTASNGVTYQPPANGWKVEPERMRQLDAEGRLHFPAKTGGRLRLKSYLDEAQGVPLQDVWTDVSSIGGTSPERLGYPTQKPVTLLKRLIDSSTNRGDLVLDPFCGCGTTIDAAQSLGRRWIGIDITTLAIDLIDARLRHTHGEAVRQTYDILGIPKDVSGAEALFRRSPFEFERWCVMLLDGQPNDKQVGDKGGDGVIRFPVDGRGNSERIIVSVKGGATNPGHVRDLIGTLQSQRAVMGIFVCLRQPTRAMMEVANRSGIYVHPATRREYPTVQLITVPELLAGKRPKLPYTLLPYVKAKPRIAEDDQPTLL